MKAIRQKRNFSCTFFMEVQDVERVVQEEIMATRLVQMSGNSLLEKSKTPLKAGISSNIQN